MNDKKPYVAIKNSKSTNLHKKTKDIKTKAARKEGVRRHRSEMDGDARKVWSQSRKNTAKLNGFYAKEVKYIRSILEQQIGAFQDEDQFIKTLRLIIVDGLGFDPFK